ncbi:MAG: type protein [Gemmatimonadetes bacterium]|nr:type protein [Gemmatimonadota bacterium]
MSDGRVVSIKCLHAAQQLRSRHHQAASRAKVLPERAEHFRRATGRSILPVVALLLASAAIPLAAQSLQPSRRSPPSRPTIFTTVTVDASHPLASFSPSTALGAGLDGHGKGTLRDIYSPRNIAAMRSAGLSRITYRLRTELGIEAWHWNPNGRWSDSAHNRGYWISDSLAATPITLTHGYRLPRRGNTIDQADNTGYSRLDDGDTTTFWKSNPYLDPALDPDGPSHPHPQWVIADLGAVSRVNTIRIAWANPFATDFRVQYWRGDVVNDIDESPSGRWVTFPRGDVHASPGGDQQLSLADSAIPTRFVRLILTRSSHTAEAGALDARDSAGYAIRELWIGGSARGKLIDVLRHGASRQAQSLTYASSTDPWHRPSDIDLDLEQPGFDRVATSGLANGQPMMIPVPVLFSTPEDGANELRFLVHRGYAFDRVELGEEPDGQYITPEDYASFYLRWAHALRGIAPRATLGGPSFQSPESQVMMAWPDDSAGAPWMTRFLAALEKRNRLADFGFLSFEWYPFDDVCAPTPQQLASAPGRLSEVIRRLHEQGIPRAFPIIISEFGYSAFASRAEVDLEGALYDADLVGHFLSLGGTTAFLYGYEPTYLDSDPRCNAWGNNALFLATNQRTIRSPVAAFYAIHLITHQWLEPVSSEHAMYAASPITAGKSDSLLSAFAVKRPDGKWSVLLVNRDASRSRTVRLRFGGDSSAAVAAGLHDEWLFSRAQYRWSADGENGHPARDSPPSHRRTRDDGIVLPPYSLAVVRELH